MRIALIGSFGLRQDEGMRKLCAQVESAVRPHHEVLTLQTRDFCTGRAWRQLRAFRPDCLHYLTGPTLASLVALRFHQLTLPGRPVTVATGIRPYFGKIARRLVWLFAPDHYLAQARRWERLFSAAGVPTVDWPNGVDTRRFTPATSEARAELRRKWDLPADRRVAIHVGHVRENRNITSLCAVQASGEWQVLVVGSESQSDSDSTRQQLEAAGCRVHTRYIPTIQEIYQLADAYVFTVIPTPAGEFPASYNQVGVIDLPLSILEAMATNLPVVSTRHDAVEHFLGGNPAVAFFDGTGADALAQLRRLDGRLVQARARAEELELGRVMAQLNAFYATLARPRR